MFWSFPFKRESELVQTNKVSYVFGRNLLGHQAEANLPSLGETPQRAGVYMGCGGTAHMTKDFAKKLFLSELLHPLVQRRAQIFTFPSSLCGEEKTEAEATTAFR